MTSKIVNILEEIFVDLLNPGIWSNKFKEFAFYSSTFVVDTSLLQGKMCLENETSFMEKLGNKIMPLRKFPLVIMVFVFGIDHFIYFDFVKPAWIPGNVF